MGILVVIVPLQTLCNKRQVLFALFEPARSIVHQIDAVVQNGQTQVSMSNLALATQTQHTNRCSCCSCCCFSIFSP